MIGEIAVRAARKGLWLWPLSPSYLNSVPRHGFILGFGNTASEEMSHAVAQLRAEVPRLIAVRA